MPYLDLAQKQLLFEADKGIKTPLLPFADTYLLSNISDSDLDEEEDQHDIDIELTPEEDLDLYPTSISSQQPKWAHKLIKAVGDVVGNLDDRRRTRS